MRRRNNAARNALARHWLIEQANRQRPHFVGRPGGYKVRKSKHGMEFTHLVKLPPSK